MYVCVYVCLCLCLICKCTSVRHELHEGREDEAKRGEDQHIRLQSEGQRSYQAQSFTAQCVCVCMIAVRVLYVRIDMHLSTGVCTALGLH